MRRVVRLAWSRERGQVLPLTAVFLALVLLPVAGFVVDGGMLFMERRDLANTAGAAATAAAQRIDEAQYRLSGGQVVVLDEPAARAVALQHATAAGLTAQVATTPRSVEVTVTKRMRTSFLRVVGIDELEVRATGRAVPRYDAAPGP